MTTEIIVEAPARPDIKVDVVVPEVTIEAPARPNIVVEKSGGQGPPGEVAVGTTTTLPPGSQATVTDSDPSVYKAVFNFGIPEGIQGEQGEVEVGSTTTLPPGSAATVTDSDPSIHKAVLEFGIPEGIQGVQGEVEVGSTTTLPPGSSATVTDSDPSIHRAVLEFGVPEGWPASADAGTTTTGAPGTPAQVTNVGTTRDAVFDFVVPEGHPSTVDAGTTTTGDPGTPAQVTNVGTSRNAVFDFVVPAGVQGVQGVQGEVAVGSVVTLAPGSQATVTDSDPSPHRALLDFGIPAGVTTVGTLNDLTDVDTTGMLDGQTIVYNSSLGTYQPGSTFDQATADANYVNIGGDVMTGRLKIDAGPGAGVPLIELRTNNGTQIISSDGSSYTTFSNGINVPILYTGGIGFTQAGAQVDMNMGSIIQAGKFTTTSATGHFRNYSDYNAGQGQADQGFIHTYANRTAGSAPQAAFQVHKSGDPTENPFLVSSNGYGWYRNLQPDKAVLALRAASGQVAKVFQVEDPTGTPKMTVASDGTINAPIVRVPGMDLWNDGRIYFAAQATWVGGTANELTTNKPLLLPGAPSAPLHAASRQYVDDQVAGITGGGTNPIGPAGGDLTGAYPNPQIAAGVIVDADISGTAAIAQGKVANLTTDLAGKEAVGVAAGLVTAHESALDPHPQYTTPAELPTTLPPSGTAGGDLAGTYPNPTVPGLAGKENTGVAASLDAAHVAAADPHPQYLTAAELPAPPTTLPPSGTAGGDLAGTYPNPTVPGLAGKEAVGVAASLDAAHVAAADPHPQYLTSAELPAPPTTLPPSGAAGGDLTGTYPNPTLATDRVRKSGDTMSGNLTLAELVQLVMPTPGSAVKGRLQTLPGTPDWLGYTLNCQYDPSGWLLDDTSKKGWFFKLDSRTSQTPEFAVYCIPEGANPHVNEFPVMRVSHEGLMTLSNRNPAGKALDITGTSGQTAPILQVNDVAIAGLLQVYPNYVAANTEMDANQGLYVGSWALSDPNIQVMAPAPTDATHLTRKDYVDSSDSLRVLKSGDTMSGPLNMGGAKITSVATPTDPNDGVNKAYADALAPPVPNEVAVSTTQPTDPKTLIWINPSSGAGSGVAA